MRIPPRALLLALLAILALALVLTLVAQFRPPASGPLGADPVQGASVLSAPATAPADSGMGTPGPPHKLLAASTLSEFTVTNEQGMLLGQVENVLVDLPTGRVQYAFLMLGRDPATANLYFAVPFAALDLNRQGQGFILHGELNDYQSQVPLSREVLALTPVLPSDFRRVFGPANDAGSQPATPLPGVSPIPTVGPSQGPLVLIPQIIGWTVRNSQGQALGAIQDFPIGPGQRVIRWAVLVPAGARSTNPKVIPVPLAALQLDGSARSMRLDLDPATVAAAPGFSQDNWPDTFLPDWDAPFVAYWQHRGILTQR